VLHLFAGFEVHQVRDMSEAYGDLVTGQYTVDTAQAEVTDHLEKFIAPSTSAVQLLGLAGLWPADRPMDRVLFGPWGSEAWPHFFSARPAVASDSSAAVDITTSLLSERWAVSAAAAAAGRAATEIRYTLDGSSPTATSPRVRTAAGDTYGVVRVNTSGWICAAAFDKASGRRTSANDSCALNVLHRDPGICNFTAGAVGSACEVDLQIASLQETYARGPSIYRKAPTRNTSWVGGPIVLYGTQFASGIGFWAPHAANYNISGLQHYKRLVLYVGVDQGRSVGGIGEHGPEPERPGLLSWYMGWARAGLPLVRLQVWVDGRRLAETPSLNVHMAPYVIDVLIPTGSQMLRLVAVGAKGIRDASYAFNYLDAVGGFLLSATPSPPPPPPPPATNGANDVSAQTCGATGQWQRWELVPRGTSSSQGVAVQLLPSAASLCLDAKNAAQLQAVACDASSDMQLWDWNATGKMLSSRGNHACTGGATFGCCVSELGNGAYKSGDVINLYGCCDPKPPCTNQQITLVAPVGPSPAGSELVIERAGLCLSVTQPKVPRLLPVEPASILRPKQIRTAHGPLRPAAVPILPGLNIGAPGVFLVGSASSPAWKGPLNYAPVRPDSTLKVNGTGRLSQTLGGWGRFWLTAGDLPVVALSGRNGNGAYSAPCALPGLGASATARVGVTNAAGVFKWLDGFVSINATRSTTGWAWVAADPTHLSTGCVVHLQLLPLVHNQTTGFILRFDATQECREAITLTWAVGRVGAANDTVDVVMAEGRAPLARLATKLVGPSDPLDPSAYAMAYTELSAGPVGTSTSTAFTAAATALDGGGQAPVATRSGDRCAVFQVHLSAGGASSDFLVLSGYKGHNHTGVDQALSRLDLQSDMFVSQTWLAELKTNWFQHWIGGSLQPRSTFDSLRTPGGFNAAVAAYNRYAAAATSRLVVETDDVLFDVAIGNIAGKLAMLYEYPAFIHGAGDAKFGKISYGQSPWSFAGYHKEVASSLHFYGGSQDKLTGRNRYWSIPFVISGWAEEQDFYMVQHCLWNFRWTGDMVYLRTIYPACRRALEHGIAANDPDGDGFHTGVNLTTITDCVWSLADCLTDCRLLYVQRR
jgi:hypothetical protein